MKKYIFTYYFLFIVFCGLAQHNPLQSTYYFNQENINPGYTGYYNIFTATIGHRNQWIGMPGAPENAWISIQSPIKNKNIALGGTVFTEEIGVTKHGGIFFNYAYRLNLNNNILSLGLTGGFDFIEQRYSEIETTDNQIDPEFESGNEEIKQPNIGFGLFYNCKYFYAGLSVPYLVQRDNPGHVIGPKGYVNNVLFTAGKRIAINNTTALIPSVLFRTNIRSDYQVDINSLVVFHDIFWAGISYRQKEALILILKYDITSNFSLGVSHDFGLSKLATFNEGTNELFIRFRPRYKTAATNPMYF